MAFPFDLCPHGLDRNECSVCRESMQTRPEFSLVKDMRNFELSPPLPKFHVGYEDILPKPLVSPNGTLENTIQNPLYKERAASLRSKAPGQAELDEVTQLFDMDKKFLKKIEI